MTSRRRTAAHLSAALVLSACAARARVGAPEDAQAAALRTEGCGACHAAHGSRVRGLLSAPQATLCGRCHDPAKLDGGGPVQHGSGPSPECSACHEPHASDRAGPTKASGDGLCRPCHRGEARSRTHPHAAMLAGCRSCHPPHNGRKKLLAVPVAVLCRSCHDGARRPGASERDERVHLPVAVGECTACHDAHGSDYPAMTRARLDRVCFACHSDAEARFATRYPHAPVAEGKCAACHSGHAGTTANHLGAPADALCRGCHPGPGPKTEPAASRHARFEARPCLECHAPHGSGVEGMLREERPARPRDDRSAPSAGRGGACVSCHAAVAAAARAASFPHPPSRRGCLACHERHGAGDRAPAAAVSRARARCAACHAPDRPGFVRTHRGYPARPGGCTSCHDPHGSDVAGSLWAHVHPPVAAGQCAACHERPPSGTPVAPGRGGVAPCRDCHAKMLAATAARSRVHQPVAEGACLACHDPHGSRERGLLRAGMLATCGKCHEDTLRRQRASRVRHPPIADGRCTLCHDAHASDRPLLFTAEPAVGICRGCHPGAFHGHQLAARAHPRNPNVSMDCMSCHRAHGTENDHLLPVPNKGQLCARCHMSMGG